MDINILHSQIYDLSLIIENLSNQLNTLKQSEYLNLKPWLKLNKIMQIQRAMDISKHKGVKS